MLRQEQITKAKNDFITYIRNQSKKNTHKSAFIKSHPMISSDNNNIENDDFNNL